MSRGSEAAWGGHSERLTTNMFDRRSKGRNWPGVGIKRTRWKQPNKYAEQDENDSSEIETKQEENEMKLMKMNCQIMEHAG